VTPGQNSKRQIAIEAYGQETAAVLSARLGVPRNTICRWWHESRSAERPLRELLALKQAALDAGLFEWDVPRGKPWNFEMRMTRKGQAWFDRLQREKSK
jgi:hypothetical protein